MENEKEILHSKSWDVYMNRKLLPIKFGCYVEVSGSGGYKII